MMENCSVIYALDTVDSGWKIGVGWTRKLVIIGGVLNILALSLIILSVVSFTPVTLLASVSISRLLMDIALVLYVVLVIVDLRRRGVI